MDVNALSQGGQNLYNVNDNSVNNSEEIQSVNNNEITRDSKDNKNEPISAEDAKKAAEKINKLLEDKNTHIEYEQDKELKHVMIMKVVDNDTNKVVNQIPSKQVLDMITDFCNLAGLLIDRRM